MKNNKENSIGLEYKEIKNSLFPIESNVVRKVLSEITENPEHAYWAAQDLLNSEDEGLVKLANKMSSGLKSAKKIFYIEGFVFAHKFIHKQASSKNIQIPKFSEKHIVSFIHDRLDMVDKAMLNKTEEDKSGFKQFVIERFPIFEKEEPHLSKAIKTIAKYRPFGHFLCLGALDLYEALKQSKETTALEDSFRRS
jgi:hypothetical protein